MGQGPRAAQAPRRRRTGAAGPPLLSLAALKRRGLGGAGWWALSGARIRSAPATSRPSVLQKAWRPAVSRARPKLRRNNNKPATPTKLPMSRTIPPDRCNTLKSDSRAAEITQPRWARNGEEISKVAPVQRPAQPAGAAAPPGRVGQNHARPSSRSQRSSRNTPQGVLPVRRTQMAEARLRHLWPRRNGRAHRRAPGWPSSSRSWV